jgi:hypothetical protein
VLGGVGGVGAGPLLQPALNPAATISTIAPNSVVQRRRRTGTGTRKNSNAAIATPPPIGNRCIFGSAIVAEVAVVVTVSVAVTAVVLVTTAGALTEQVVVVFVVGVTAQLRATLPVNPPVGVTVIIDVPLAP